MGRAGTLCRIMNRQEDMQRKLQIKESGKMREGGTDESIKETMTKIGRWEQGEREKDRRGGGSTWRTAVLGSQRVKLRKSKSRFHLPKLEINSNITL